MCFGRLFGIQVLIQSGLLQRSSTTLEEIIKMIDMLFDFMGSKMYLKQVCTQILINLMQTLSDSEHSQSILAHILSKMTNGINNTEFLWIALQMESMDGDISCLMKGNEWKNKSLLHPDNKVPLGNILKESTFNHPQIHPVWLMILEKTGHSQTMTLRELWEFCVEGILFESSHERRYLGFLLFQKMVQMAAKEDLPFLFTQKFMRSFMKNLSEPDNYLYKIAKQTVIIHYYSLS
jgi:DNA polymerase phi